MNKAVIIAEKNSQAKDLYKALIADKAYNKTLCQALNVGRLVITHASGHILALVEPQEVNPEWGNWSSDVLMPNTHFYPLKVSEPKLYKQISTELKSADMVIIATDCDREGQLIGENIIRHAGFNGTVKRAIFTAQDEKSLQKAFMSLHNNTDFVGVYYAGQARANGDQIANLSNTRAVSVHLKDPRQKGAIGVGRVKTATQAIVCQRQEQIDSFTSEDFYTPYITVQDIKLSYIGSGDISQYQTEKKGAFFDKGNLDSFIANISDTCAIAKTVENKKTNPPKLPDLPELQKATSKLWGWGADKTLATLQSLYESPNYLTTYPRAECRNIPETMIDDVPAILSTLKSIFDIALAKPEIRQGKNGAYDTKTVEQSSHHAIIPNINCEQTIERFNALDNDQKALYNLICQYWLRMHAPNYTYEQTIITGDVDGVEFQTKGNIPLNMGWKAINLCKQPSDSKNSTLPPIENGNYAIEEKAYDTGKTNPPNQFTDGDLISAMQNAWKYATNPDMQEKLKASKGIGTPATRDSIIKGLLDQNILTQKGKYIIPTATGQNMYVVFKSVCPSLLSPVETATMEIYLDKIATIKDEDTAQQATKKYLDIVASKTQKINDAVETAGAKTTLPITGTTYKPKRKGNK